MPGVAPEEDGVAALHAMDLPVLRIGDLVRLADLESVGADVSGLPSIGNIPNARRNTPGSDHAPLIAHFA